MMPCLQECSVEIRAAGCSGFLDSAWEVNDERSTCARPERSGAAPARLPRAVRPGRAAGSPDDSRVRALWVSGSLARRDADAYSDLDLLAAVADADFDAFAASWKSWLADITPTVLARAIPFLPGSFYSLTPTCERLDVVLERVSRVPSSFFRARAVVFDRDGLDAQVPKPRAARGTGPREGRDRDRGAAALSRAVPGGARPRRAPARAGGLRPHAPAHLGALPRDERAAADDRREALARQAARPSSTRCSKRCPGPRPTREALIDANIAVARALVAHGKPIAEKVGLPLARGARGRGARAPLRELGELWRREF